MNILKMYTLDLAAENFAKLIALFPNAVAEMLDADGKVVVVPLTSITPTGDKRPG